MYDVFDIIVKNKKIRQKTNSLMNKTNFSTKHLTDIKFM